MNDYWKFSKHNRRLFILVATPDLLKIFNLKKLKFYENRTYGFGDLYTFQGDFDLGLGTQLYILTASAKDSTVSVKRVTDTGSEDVSPEEQTAGVNLAKKLVLTLPELTACTHSLAWLKQVW